MKGTQMSTASRLVAQNKENLVIAAQIETGKVVLTNFKKILKPVLPFFARGYIDHPIADFIIANLGRATIMAFPVLERNKSLVWAIDSALLAAATEPVAQLGIPKLIEDKLGEVLAGVKIPEFGKASAAKSE